MVMSLVRMQVRLLLRWECNFHPASYQVPVITINDQSTPILISSFLKQKIFPHTKQFYQLHPGSHTVELAVERQTECMTSVRDNSDHERRVYVVKSSRDISALIPPQLLCPTTTMCSTCRQWIQLLVSDQIKIITASRWNAASSCQHETDPIQTAARR
jgi:hypothetical protein